MNNAERLRKLCGAIDKIDKGSPPDDWEYYDGLHGYLGHKVFERAAPDYVDSPDDSNSGDMHGHGWSCGYWQAAKELRATRARATLALAARGMELLGELEPMFCNLKQLMQGWKATCIEPGEWSEFDEDCFQSVLGADRALDALLREWASDTGTGENQ